MITFKLGEIKNISNSFSTIIKHEISMKLSWDISDILQEIIQKEELYNQKMVELLNKYSKRDQDNKIIYDKDKKTVNIQEDKLQEYNDKAKELNELKITINKEPILLQDLLKEDFKISPIDLYVLRNFIKK